MWAAPLGIRSGPGLSAGAVPSLARTRGVSPESAVPGAIRSKDIPARLRCFSPLVRPDQTATALTQLKLTLMDSRLTFEMGGVHDRFIAASH